MPNDVSNQLDILTTKIKNGERGGDDTDRDLLLTFSNRLALLREEYSDHRHLKLLRHCTRIAEHAGSLADALDERDAAEDLVRWIHSEYDSEETNRDYRVALRMFGKRTTDGDDIPDSLSWISTKTSRSYNPSPDPAAMLRWEDDIKSMLDGCRNARDEAAIALQFDAGLRGGELYDLTLGDITESDHTVRVRVDGKTGQRSVDLIPSIPHVNKWLAIHPGRGDDDAPLWTKLNSPDQLSYQSYLDMFKVPAERAGVDKTVTPTAFRKSNASWLARRGANAALIEDRQGRTRGSQAVARYVARFGDDAEVQYAKMHGLEVETEEDEDLAPLECPRCQRETPRDEPACVWCGLALDHETAEKAQAISQRLRDGLAGEEGDVAQALVQVGELMDEHPWLRSVIDVDDIVE
jgi:integrase